METFKNFMECKFLSDTFAQYRRDEVWTEQDIARVIADELTIRHWELLEAGGPEPSEDSFDDSKKGRRFYKVWRQIEDRHDDKLYAFNQIALANVWGCDPP